MLRRTEAVIIGYPDFNHGCQIDPDFVRLLSFFLTLGGEADESSATVDPERPLVRLQPSSSLFIVL